MTDRQKLDLISELIFDYYEYSSDADGNQRSAAALISAVNVVLRFGDDVEKYIRLETDAEK